MQPKQTVQLIGLKVSLGHYYCFNVAQAKQTFLNINTEIELNKVFDLNSSVFVATQFLFSINF
jgi:hypothetical protein